MGEQRNRRRLLRRHLHKPDGEEVDVMRRDGRTGPLEPGEPHYTMAYQPWAFEEGDRRPRPVQAHCSQCNQLFNMWVTYEGDRGWDVSEGDEPHPCVPDARPVTVLRVVAGGMVYMEEVPGVVPPEGKVAVRPYEGPVPADPTEAN